MKFPPKIIKFIENNFDIRKIEDEQFLRTFKNLITSELNLNSYLREISFRDLSKYKAVAYYSQESKQIVMNPNGIKKELELLSIDINPRTIAYQIFIALLHEITHINQIHEFETSKTFNTYELCLAHSQLVRLGYIHLNLKAKPKTSDKLEGRRLYLENGILFPIEREAEITAWEFMLPIYEKLMIDNIREIEQLRASYSSLIFEDYEETSPLEKFYTLIDRHDIFEKLDFKSYNTHERCLYGMPLTAEEYFEELEKSLTITKR